jgi:hypothetical protein
VDADCPAGIFWIAVVLVRLLAGRLCTVSSEEAIGLFFGELFFFVVIDRNDSLWVLGEEGQRQRQRRNKGFFAALRMTQSFGICEENWFCMVVRRAE